MGLGTLLPTAQNLSNAKSRDPGQDHRTATGRHRELTETGHRPPARPTNPPHLPVFGTITQGTATITTRQVKGVNVARIAGSRTSAKRAMAATPGSAPDAKLAQAHPQVSALGVENPIPDGVVNKFVNISRLKQLLADHPDQSLVASIVAGFEFGFDIGFRGTLTDTFCKNNKSALRHREGVTEAIKKEISRGHTAGPFNHPPFPINHVSPLGAVPKPDGTIRLIMDLSQPVGRSVNDFISKEEFPCKYTPFDEATKLVRQEGRGCLLTKVDIKHAYRLLPVRPEDWPLLVYCWEEQYCVDLKLPFGGRSSASIFTDFADLICWIACNKYNLLVIHYSDDYLMISPPDMCTAAQEKKVLLSVFRYLNIPVAEDKLLGPTTSLPYLGIQINTISMEVSVPEDKLKAILEMLPKWCGRRTATKQQLLSLIGKLHHISLVVTPGRLFLRRLITLSTSVKNLHHHINMNKEAQRDIHWWCEWLPTWNSSSFIPETRAILSSDICLFTDASGKGLGAVYGDQWIQAQWHGEFAEKDVDFQEGFAILAAAYTWGSQWAGSRVIFVTDNQPMTQIWENGTTTSPTIMSVVRKIFLVAVQNQFSVAFKHIRGHHNPIADAISRFQMEKFRQLHPSAAAQKTQIPPEAWILKDHSEKEH